jgi:uncharacterized membrane protein/GNAT superfamily N-acetyltransferase
VARTYRQGLSELRGALWVKPAVAVVASLIVGAGLSQIELTPASPIGRLAFRGDADDARQLLTTVTGTMITVTSLVFVLTVVALQIASTQFSPRLMRTFLRDNGTQVVLSTFVGTVAYSLAGLYTVGGETDAGERFIPRLAVSVSLVLALISVGMLVYYIQHFTNGIRINTIMRHIEESTLALVRSTLPPAGSAVVDVAPPDVPADARVVTAAHAGYVQGFDLDRVRRAAVRNGLHLRYMVIVGYHVIRGTPVAWVWGGGGDADHDVAVARAGVRIEPERRFENDFGFALRQLVDIALRAVAPSRNDPYTAVQAIHHLTAALAEAAAHPFVPHHRADADGTIRVWAPVDAFEVHLRTVCDHLRWSTATEPRVVLALLRLLGNVSAACSDTSRVEAVRRQVALVLDDAEREIRQPATSRRSVARPRWPNVASPCGGESRTATPASRRYTCCVTDELTFTVEPADTPEALACLRAYVAELDELFPGGFTPGGCGVVDVDDLRPPLGGFVVARRDRRAIGCGGVRTLAPAVGEIKRMWLHPDVRGRGAGRRLLAACEDLSRSLGHKVVRLDTSRHLGAAIALYRSSGYDPILPYNDNTDADHWFQKGLPPA